VNSRPFLPVVHSLFGDSRSPLTSMIAMSNSIARAPSPRALAPRRTRDATRIRRLTIANAMRAQDVRAMGDRVLVLADAQATQTKSGLFLASANANQGPGSSVTGEVASVGADVKALKKGDKVLVNGFAGTEIEFEGGVKGKFVRADDVLAVLS